MQTHKPIFGTLWRIRIWYVLILIFCCVVIVRLFYLQVIQHDYYKTAALSGQMKEYELPAARGAIDVHNGSNARVPLVLNESRYTLFADPKYIEDKDMTAQQIAVIIGGNESDIRDQLSIESRYVILQKKLTKDQKQQIENLELKGIGLRETPVRTYPQGTLAAQLLGFVNDDGEGVYGIEQALNSELQGKPGMLKAITDARGVPLAANRENTLVEPQDGDRLLLTIDIGMQQQLESILEQGVKRSRGTSGGAMILDARNGGIKAMANYPSYNPAEFFKVKGDDASVFQNGIVSQPLEVGSIMKPLTLAAALDQGVVSRDTVYYDPNQFTIDGATITNVEESSGIGNRSMGDILQLSLNTGATWLLKQMGGGEVNDQARERWHRYMTEHYQLGKKTNIEQGYEAPGDIPSPTEGYGLNIQFANTSFGQGMTATLLQMAAALAASVNGGTYYQPRLVDARQPVNGENIDISPIIAKDAVISKQASTDLRFLMEYAFAKNHTVYGMRSLRDGYHIGGKTGTAQVPRPEGGYYEDRFNGTFMGYVGGDMPEYVIIVRVDDPKIDGYAGSKAAGPIFVQVAEALIDNFGVSPRRE
jgi:cell division protein FtsI/penicillin-binding protein 2